MYRKKGIILNVLIYLAITLSIAGLFILQLKSTPLTNFIYFVVSLIVFLASSEIMGKLAGIYIVILTIILYLSQVLFKLPAKPDNFYLTAYGLIVFFLFYFLIRVISKRKFEKTYAREKHFRSLANFNLQPLILKNGKGEVLFASESIKDILGLKKNIELGKGIGQFIHPEDVNIYEKFLIDVIQNPFEKKTIELRMIKGNSGWIWVKKESINLLDHEDIRAIVSSIQDITFQKELDREKVEIITQEKKARSLAEKAVRDRDEFFSIASHELKTPLTTVILQLQVTLRKISTQSLADFSGHDLMNSLQIAEKQSQSLSTLIKDLLNLSLASTGRLTLNKEAVNLAELTELLLTKYVEEIKLSGCQVSKNIRDAQIVGNWDPVRIEQAMTNLLMNALKYAKGKDITITTKKEEGWGVFQVRDEGPGIEEEFLVKIFEPFARATNNPATKGLGVGLFITKQIAIAHSGDISVKSRLGKGSTFILKLPVSSENKSV